jgi:uncharacterized protein (TIGR03000 family)
MYSVIVMAALSAGASTPDCCFTKCCYSCAGCYGCWGCGGCYGCVGCYGCHGGPYWGCGGCYGCYGACYGCYGACYGLMDVTGSWTCHGCYGGPIIYSGATPVYAPSTPLAPMTPAPATPPETVPPPKDKDKDKTSLPSKARLIVQLPAGAKLYVDDQLSKNTAERRVFSTPTLEPGQSYYYILRAELEKDGKTYSDTRRVIVKAGAEVTASFVEADFKVPAGSAVAVGAK